MSTSTQQIADLIASNTDLKAYFEGVRDSIAGDQLAHGLAVDAFIRDAKDSVWLGSEMTYNPATVFSKDGMALAADPVEPSRTVWGAVESSLVGSRVAVDENAPVVLAMAQVVCSAPGASEDPVYQVDNSVTKVQFVLANINASSEDINSLIDVGGVVVPTFGETVIISSLAYIPAVRKDGISSNARLYARFINEVAPSSSVPSGAVPQGIGVYGGNTVFSLNRLNH